jgi:hypothetical protein
MNGKEVKGVHKTDDGASSWYAEDFKAEVLLRGCRQQKLP